MAGRTAGGQRALSVGRSARAGPRGPQSPRPDASAGALMAEAPLACPGRPGRTVPTVSQVTLREAATPAVGRGWRSVGRSSVSGQEADPSPGTRCAPRPSHGCSLASRSLGPSERPAPESALVTGGGPLRGGPLSRCCRPQALHAAQGLGTPVASLRGATPVGPESPERPPKLKRVSWRSLPTGGRRPREATWPRKPLVSPAGQGATGTGRGRWGLWPPW